MDLRRADLRGAYLQGADFGQATLEGADLREADLEGADLSVADLRQVNLSGANLKKTTLNGTQLIKTNLSNATLTGSSVYGVSVWDIEVNNCTTQQNLIITAHGEPVVTVDDIKVAQFIYLLLNNQEIRNVINTITSKAVLLLGRFTPERKAILDALAEELRKNNLVPIIFDFERSKNRDFTETIKILAGLSLFVIADVTKPKSVPQELTATIPDYQMPFAVILEEGEEPYSMLADLMKYDWVHKPLIIYRTKEMLLANFKKVVDWAWKKHLELQRKKNERLEMVSIDQMTGWQE